MLTKPLLINPDITHLTEQEATQLLIDTPILDEDTCTWIEECAEPAVRLAMFTITDKKYNIKYLCDRHKKMGMW